MRQTVLTIVLVLLQSPAIFAQRSQVEIATEVISSMDRNRDGRLEAGEIPLRSRAAVGKLAREAELDLAKPLSIEKLKKQLARRKQKEEERERKEQRDKPLSPSPAAATDSISGFGNTSETSSVAGFGTADQADVRSVASPSKSGFKDEKTQSDAEKAAEKDRVREYAEGLLRRYDANKNGVLDKDEWSKMKGNPAESDTNKDGRLSVDELTVRLRNYGGNEKTKSKGTDSKARPKKTSRRYTKKTNTSKKSYRFLTPTERLAATLPISVRDWFLRNDKNGDGQIAMTEFASIWSREKAADFASYDQNNDGVITPQEYLRVKTGVATNN